MRQKSLDAARRLANQPFAAPLLAIFKASHDLGEGKLIDMAAISACSAYSPQIVASLIAHKLAYEEKGYLLLTELGLKIGLALSLL